MIVLVTGGTRSGKSRYAQQRAKLLHTNPVYVATARLWDDNFKERIARHQRERGPEWINFETEKYISTLTLTGKVVVIDCVTLWLTNFFVDHQQNIDNALREFQQEINKLNAQQTTFIIITNEIGMGLHADTEVGRKFVDLQGWANQYLASKADEVIFMVSGIPLQVKPVKV